MYDQGCVAGEEQGWGWDLTLRCYSFLPPVFGAVLCTHCSCHLFATNHVYMFLKLSTLSLVVWAVLQFPVGTANSQAHLKVVTKTK